MELLLEDIEKLKYLAEHASSKSKKREYILTLESLLEFLSELENKENTYTPTNIKTSFLDKSHLTLQKEIISEYGKKEYKEFINTICKNVHQKLKPYNEELYFNDIIKFKHAKELLLDFFNSFDPKLYPLIKEILSENHLFIVNDTLMDGEGYSLFNPFSNNSYICISIQNKLKFNNVVCLAHELGHIISFQKFKDNPHSYRNAISNTFCEVPSFSFEFLFVDFLIKNKINPMEIEKVIGNNLYIFNSYMIFLKVINRVIDRLDPLKTYELEELQEILRSSGIVKSDNFVELCFNNFTGCHIYGIGNLIAHYYLTKYRLDEEKTKNNIMSFINGIGIYNDFDMMTNFGINIDELKRCEFINQEINRNQKQLRKTTQF